MSVLILPVERHLAYLRHSFLLFSYILQLFHSFGSHLAKRRTERCRALKHTQKMKNIHYLISLYKTTLFRNMICLLIKSVINKSCVWFNNCDNSLGIPSNKMQKELKMTALLRVISLVVISVVVIIIPPCGAALGRGKA